MRHEDMDIKKLVEYALALDVGVVYRRLGYMLELFETEEPDQLDLLRKKLDATYALLDPMLPTEGKFTASWLLRVNVTPAEIKTIIRT